MSCGPPDGPTHLPHWGLGLGPWAPPAPVWPLSQPLLTPAKFLKTAHLSSPISCPGHLGPRPVGASWPFLPLPLGPGLS